MKTRLFAIAILAASGAPGAADRPATLADKLIEEYAACAAYYQFVAVDLSRLGEDDSAAGARGAATIALRRATAAAQEGRTETQAEAVARARTDFYIRGIAGHIDRKAGNISLLAGKPGHRCRRAIEAPDAFRDELAKEVSKAPVNR